MVIPVSSPTAQVVLRCFLLNMDCLTCPSIVVTIFHMGRGSIIHCDIDKFS